MRRNVIKHCNSNFIIRQILIIIVAYKSFGFLKNKLINQNKKSHKRVKKLIKAKKTLRCHSSLAKKKQKTMKSNNK